MVTSVDCLFSIMFSCLIIFSKFRLIYFSLKVGSINSIFYFLHKAAEPFNCLEQDNLA